MARRKPTADESRLADFWNSEASGAKQRGSLLFKDYLCAGMLPKRNGKASVIARFAIPLATHTGS